MSPIYTPGKLILRQTYIGLDDPDAAAYITAVEIADGQPLEVGVRVAIHSFVKGCKADGIWPAIKASCILAGARTLAGALVPLVGTAPTNFNFVEGDYNRKTGLAGDGSTKYLDSNRNNNADPQNNQHCSVYMSTAPTSGVSLIGASTTATGATNVLLTASRSRNATAVIYPAIATAPSFVGISRGSSSSYTQRSNSTTTSVTQSSETPVSVNFLLYARLNIVTATVDVFSNPRLAFYSIGESLDLALLDTRVTALINAFAAAIP